MVVDGCHKGHHRDGVVEDSHQCEGVAVCDVHNHHDHNNHDEEGAENVRDSESGGCNHGGEVVVEGHVCRSRPEEDIHDEGVIGSDKGLGTECAPRQVVSEKDEKWFLQTRENSLTSGVHVTLEPLNSRPSSLSTATLRSLEDSNSTKLLTMLVGPKGALTAGQLTLFHHAHG